MPKGVHTDVLELPVQAVWDFVSVMDKWAPLVPGYIEHEVINDRESTWTFEGDLGFMKKEICMKVHITSWQEPSKVAFDLTGINENFTGEGYFRATPIGENVTEMTGCLDISAKGMMAPVVNGVLKSFVPNTATELTKGVSERLKEVHGVKS
ncbi:SRPBCC family protein [Cytobacillus spongiae]|uniref:CoxG family protein n=1 Tax=Cytobacillus spongiae TaxID=2901381 RepID=UPI001F244864|nr:SRPBCC family protein [Cytobacillus spongiae]UII54237.1 SRPBCC family protein [Cytobacillus spongiae]